MQPLTRPKTSLLLVSHAPGVNSCVCACAPSILHLGLILLFILEVYTCELSTQWLFGDGITAPPDSNACFDLFASSPFWQTLLYAHNLTLHREASGTGSMPANGWNGSDGSILYNSLRMRTAFELVAAIYSIMGGLAFVFPNFSSARITDAICGKRFF